MTDVYVYPFFFFFVKYVENLYQFRILLMNFKAV